MDENENMKIKGTRYCGATELVELAVKKREEEANVEKMNKERREIIFQYPWISVVLGVGAALFIGIVGMRNAFVAPLPNSTTLAIIDFFVFFFAIYAVIWIDADYHRTLRMLQSGKPISKRGKRQNGR